MNILLIIFYLIGYFYLLHRSWQHAEKRPLLIIKTIVYPFVFYILVIEFLSQKAEEENDYAFESAKQKAVSRFFSNTK